MGFSQGSATAGTLIAAFAAWLLANAPQPETLWPYLLFGAIFIALLAHLIHVVLGERIALATALLHGVALGLAAYWLEATPYRALEYVCWIFAAAYVVVAPRMMRAVSRLDLRGRRAGRVRAAHRGFDLQDVGIALLAVAAAAGLVMATGLLAREWGIYAGVGALVLWPVTLLIVPWYAALVQSEWLMLIVVYGGGLAGVLIYRVRVERQEQASVLHDSVREP